ncbi:PREDICTED: eukaryotic translation initiation factor 3 subunit C-like [Corvus brachyrhynchos]|uniref:eukaryotic translation initiation factor 3 subunit C-like n=1 Tax=Corvus brachyrhynchos TaxID=85066 RepID=UPI000816649E|nr:PREDICTED: eukaryotic translation initiation factor 3 subunit C-like [Corvus brachyrhynchos]
MPSLAQVLSAVPPFSRCPHLCHSSSLRPLPLLQASSPVPPLPRCPHLCHPFLLSRCPHLSHSSPDALTCPGALTCATPPQLPSPAQVPSPVSPLPPQILYNRTMVQLGICAFRQGLIKDAHNALLDIQSSGRAKELLGQGLLLRSLQERNAEQEKVEKRRQVPFHMHVNLELLECVYLVAAMLLEIPYMAAHEFDARRRMISKQFHHQLRVGGRAGPGVPRCARVCPGVPRCAPPHRKIQEESLRTYLFTYSSVYDSISMETLAAMFELDLPTVHGIISKMIIGEELMVRGTHLGATFGLISGEFWAHSGLILGSFWAHFGLIPGEFGAHSG